MQVGAPLGIYPYSNCLNDLKKKVLTNFPLEYETYYSFENAIPRLIINPF